MSRLINSLAIIGLVLTSLTWAGDDFQIQLKQVEPQHVLSLKAVAPSDSVRTVLTQMMGQMKAFLSQRQIKPVGPPLVVWLSPPGQDIKFEVCVPVPPQTAGQGEIEAKELSGGPMASAILTGPVDYGRRMSLQQAMEAWMRQTGWQPAGHMREVVLALPAKSQTERKSEVLWPMTR